MSLRRVKLKEKIQRMIDDFKHVTINLRPSSYSLDPSDKEYKNNSYFAICGNDGLSMNASVSMGLLTEVNICLGWLKDTGILQASKVTDEIYWKLYDRLFFVLAHEMGHRFSFITRDNNPISKTYTGPKLLKKAFV